MNMPEQSLPPLPETKPTLQQIAEMGLIEGNAAMRKFYDSRWMGALGELADDEPVMRKWRVNVDFSYREDRSEVYIVDAMTDEDAKELASDMAANDFDDIDIFSVTAKMDDAA